MSQHDNHGSHDHGHHGHHIVPFKVYYATLAALIVFTVITVGASYIDFGRANFAVALGIATIKASLVMLFFMGLKYDNNLNRAVILSSFFALFLLILFSSTDLFTRPKPTPVKVTGSVPPPSVEEFNALIAGSDEQVARGKDLYNTNCLVCHGADGKGDGIGGAALNPKPRNFHSGASEWKNGSSAKSIFVTLAYGIPNSGMASYKALPVRDRLALVHYVRSLAGAAAEKTSKADDRLAQAMKDDGVGAGGANAPKATLPIDFAVERMSKPN